MKFLVVFSPPYIYHVSRKANKDIFINREVFPNGNMYYLMKLIYVNDIQVVSKDTFTAIDYVAKRCVLKKGSIVSPYQ